MLRDTIYIHEMHNPCDDEYDEDYEEALLERNEDVKEVVNLMILKVCNQ